MGSWDLHVRTAESARAFGTACKSGDQVVMVTWGGIQFRPNLPCAQVRDGGRTNIPRRKTVTVPVPDIALVDVIALRLVDLLKIEVMARW